MSRRTTAARLEAIQESLGYRFSNVDHLRTALTHKSWVNEHPDPPTRHNERYEFLGDAVLDVIASHYLFESFPDRTEGQLSKLRAAVVSEVALVGVAKALGIGDGLRLGRGEELTGGRAKPSLLADAYEAVIAAIYLDGGIEAARAAIIRHLGPTFERADKKGAFRDHKTRLQELVQAELREVPRYRMVSASGPDHDKVFEMELVLGKEVIARGVGKSKKEAEQNAAEQGLAVVKDRVASLKEEDPGPSST